ncbi:hypothetical protein EST92_25660 [Streptomyces sp. TM32]|nr:daptide biosynthesis RiPP recognition protein [Streptomyces sp. TM32]RXS69400.1 hypothetical protein EST92_25660 [Streptomyces sp. TM32]
MIAPDGAEGVDGPDTAVTVVRYSGRFCEAGDEMLVEGAYAVELQDYLAAAYLPVVGLTVVRIMNEADWKAFLQDADLAYDQGVFVEQLAHPSVLLADKGPLGFLQPTTAGDLLRLHVTADGEVRPSAGGAVLGTVADSLAELEEAARQLPRGGVGDLHSAVSCDVVYDALVERPWLPRYIRALEALRATRQDGSVHRVSGFGGRMVEGLDVGRVEPVEAPLLLWNETEALLNDTVSGRWFRLGCDAARLVELVVTAGSRSAAEGSAVALLGMPVSVARQAIDAVEAQCRHAGIRIGGPAVIPEGAGR